MIYGRFGDEIKLVREAVLADVQKYDHRKPDKHDRERLAFGMFWIGHFADAPDELRLFELAYCRADDGWNEIDALRKSIMGAERYAEATGLSLEPTVREVAAAVR